MLKWFVTLVLAIFLLGIVSPHLARFIRFGQLPGDLKVRWRGRNYAFPLASVVIFSFVFWLVARIV